MDWGVIQEMVVTINKSRNRKFFYGDPVRFIDPRYHRHADHEGVVKSTKIIHLTSSPGTRVVYEVACNCGKVLHLKGASLE